MKNNKLKNVLFGLILTTIISNCTTTRVVSLTKCENESIELFTTKLPNRKYIEVSYIQTDGAIFHTPQQLLNGLKKKATELKADAVVNIKYDFQAWYPVVSGIAIKYNDN